MSLLLEALKKAEKAKEEAQRRARGETQEPKAALPAVQASEARTPLEIVADGAQAKRAEPTLSLTEDKPPPQPRAEGQVAERAAARKVFEAKFKEPNPRLPFVITLGALGVFAVGTVIYFWIQLRPPAQLVNLNPKPPAGQVAVAPAPAVPVSNAPVATAAPAAQSGIPGLPSATATATPAASAPKPAPRPVAREPEVPLLKPQPRTLAPAPRAPASAGTEVSASRAAPQVHPKVGSAYAAYLADDLAAARADYQQALREEPANRDALLGLAALDVRAGRHEAAETAYLRLLQADPRDAHAHAALIALRAGRVDPVAAESRVKLMLAENPGAHVLNFTLGNQFAQQGRWAEAQQEYFRAYAAEPDNPDFAYNLAVSLDHLRQPSLALQYYQRAITLAKARGASFQLQVAEDRAAQLTR
ncbi:MAG TPA: tetratricopeptide repeat protein [Burkholderiales bacterium]|nr:tetratricopeptide repeat protein [Burkholderiales bacterium]